MKTKITEIISDLQNEPIEITYNGYGFYIGRANQVKMNVSIEILNDILSTAEQMKYNYENKNN